MPRLLGGGAGAVQTLRAGHQGEDRQGAGLRLAPSLLQVPTCHTMSHCSAMLHARCALCDTSLDGVPFLHKDNSLNCVGCFTK